MTLNEGDKIIVTCTDTNNSVEGVVHRRNGNTLWVLINPAVPAIGMHLTHPGFYVGKQGGMEFTVGNREKTSKIS